MGGGHCQPHKSSQVSMSLAYISLALLCFSDRCRPSLERAISGQSVCASCSVRHSFGNVLQAHCHTALGRIVFPSLSISHFCCCSNWTRHNVEVNFSVGESQRCNRFKSIARTIRRRFPPRLEDHIESICGARCVLHKWSFLELETAHRNCSCWPATQTHNLTYSPCH